MIRLIYLGVEQRHPLHLRAEKNDSFLTIKDRMNTHSLFNTF